LKLWSRIDPALRYIFLYRNPYAVIDSLFRRRGDCILYARPWWAGGAWLRYNNEILQFAHCNRDRVICISIDGFNKSQESSISKLEKWISLPLTVPYSDVFSPGEIGTNQNLHKRWYIGINRRVYGDQLDSVYARLEEVALISSNE
jgi:hypothetical protein